MKKILCLHGYGMCGDWLREWLDPVSRTLGDGYQFIYPNAPFEAPEAEVRAMAARFQAGMPEFRIGPGKNFCWYRATDEKPPVYTGTEEAFSYLADLFVQHGKIDGVIGWSQGAVMAAMLVGHMYYEKQSPFKFDWVMPCGGFTPGDIHYRPWFEKPLDFPSLHVIGERESVFMLTRGIALADAFVNSERLMTPVGHVLPIKHPAFMTKIAEWIAGRP